jgi:phytoene dehydrogenase-like protein
MANEYDAIVIGGGHNGLVAAAYLAKNGARTICFEARERVGGAADTSQPWPDAPEFKVTTLSYVVSLVPPSIIRDLQLERFGYKVLTQGPYFVPQMDGGALALAGDKAAKAEAIAKFSKKDAENYFAFKDWIAKVANVMGPLLMDTPPHVGSKRFGDLLATGKLGWKYRDSIDERLVGDMTKLFTMSIKDLLDEWLESPVVKVVAGGVSGVIGTWAGPFEPGTAYVMAHHSIGDVGDGKLGTWGFAEGGMGAISDACRKSAEYFGAEVRTSARVSKITTNNGRATGVVLDSGEEFRSPLIVTATHPKITFLDQLERSELPPDFVRDIENWKTRSGTVKVNFAVAELPEFTSAPGFNPDVHGGTIELAPTIDYIEQAFIDARSGKAAEAPFADIAIPTVFDKTMAPEGKHIVSMFTQWVPYEWSKERNQDELEKYADRIVDLVNGFAPNFKGSILHRQVIGPWEMENDFGLIGGNIFHGELSANQLFHMRPAVGYADYRSPIDGLYQAHSGTHGGGGVNGIPAHHAVREIMRDRKVKKT